MTGTDATATENQAVFTNNYSKDPRAVTFSATKNYTENGYPYQAGMFSTKLTAIGSYATASGAKTTVAELPNNADSVPMPTGSSTGRMDADFDDFHTASFPRISFDGGTGNNTYVYKITENSGTVADATAMTYDSTEYYVFVAITVTDDMVNADISYYKNEAGTLTKVEIPTDGSNPVQFTNTYAASAVSAAPQGSKTLTGRARTAGDSFSFALTAADETTQEAVTNGTVSGAVCASNCTAESILASATSTNVTAESGESQSFEFTQLTFGKAGTYTFNVAEQSGNAGGITYDTHISTVTYVISDTDANGKHTGRLNVAKVSYSNATATTEADRKVTDAAAFTNAYHATATFAGLTVTKELHNRNAGTARNLYAGEFTFTISGDDEASAQRISAGTFASDRKFSNGYAAGSEAQSRKWHDQAFQSGVQRIRCRQNLPFRGQGTSTTHRSEYRSGEYKVGLGFYEADRRNGHGCENRRYLVQAVDVPGECHGE